MGPNKALDSEMISGKAAFDKVLAAFEGDLRQHGFVVVEASEHPESFGSRAAIFSDGQRIVRLTWDGKEHWFVLEADPNPRLNVGGKPVWIDLTLQRYDEGQADATRVSEVAEDVRAAFLEFAV